MRISHVSLALLLLAVVGCGERASPPNEHAPGIQPPGQVEYVANVLRVRMTDEAIELDVRVVRPLRGASRSVKQGSVLTLRVPWDLEVYTFMDTDFLWMRVERYEGAQTAEEMRRRDAQAKQFHDWKEEWADFLTGMGVLVVVHDPQGPPYTGHLSIWQWDRYQAGCGAEFIGRLHHVLPGPSGGWRLGVTVTGVLSNPGGVLKEGDVVEFTQQDAPLLVVGAGRMYEGMEADYTREFRVAFLEPFANPYGGLARVLFLREPADPWANWSSAE
jgi:hypothetical protein